MAKAAEVGGKDLAQVHAPSQTCCRLLTHRFKQTKLVWSRLFLVARAAVAACRSWDRLSGWDGKMRDPYATLGVTKDASAADIKSAFRRLASELHPDTGKLKAGDLLIAEPPTLIGRLLGRFTGREWRLYFVEKGKGLQYALHNKGGFQILGLLHARFNGGKRLSSRWKLYMSHFVGTAEECFELTATMFTASAEFKALDNRCRSMDRNWDRYDMLWNPHFIHVPTRRRLPLGFSFELAAEPDDTNITKLIADRLSGRAEGVTLSTICNDVFVDP
jgi:DnaJ domain